MKIVIDIPKYNLDEVQNGSLACGIILKAVKSGTVLPEGHGDLIDRNTVQMSAEKFHSLGDLYTAQWVVDTTPTVIPADK